MGRRDGGMKGRDGREGYDRVRGDKIEMRRRPASKCSITWNKRCFLIAYIHTQTQTMHITNTYIQTQSYLWYHKEQTMLFDRIHQLDVREGLRSRPLEHRRDKVRATDSPTIDAIAICQGQIFVNRV